MKKNKFSRFNDGIVRIYREKKDRNTSFSAVRNVSVLDDMDFILKLDYEESAKREQDFIFAEQRSFTLSMKIRTRRNDSIDNKCMAVIDGYLYNVSYIDHSHDEMWLYLQGVKSIDS